MEKPFARWGEDVGHAALACGQAEVVDDLLHDEGVLGAHGTTGCWFENCAEMTEIVAEILHKRKLRTRHSHREERR